MLGAIIGDIAGSRFEFNNTHSEDFELFAKNCSVTDDSIMTLAVAEAFYGVPLDLKSKAKSFLDSELLTIYEEWKTQPDE